MPDQKKMLAALRDAYDNMNAIRESGSTHEVRHAERNFAAAAEAFAGLIPRMLDERRAAERHSGG